MELCGDPVMIGLIVVYGIPDGCYTCFTCKGLRARSDRVDKGVSYEL